MNWIDRIILLACAAVIICGVWITKSHAQANAYATIWNVPANTPAESIRDEFLSVFPGAFIPEGGVMPTSVTAQGKNTVICWIAYDKETAEQMVNDAKKNWQLWGMRTIKQYPIYDTEDPPNIIGYDHQYIVPVNNSVLNFLANRPIKDVDGNVIGQQAKSLSWIPHENGEKVWH